MSSQQASYLLREFYLATNWSSVDNHYASLTHPSRQLLDFVVSPGLHLSIASHPTSNLSSGLALSSLVPSTMTTSSSTSTAPVIEHSVSPLLSGQLSYLFSSINLDHTSTKRSAKGKERIDFKDVLQSYGTEVGVPVKPELREEVRPTWRGGERVDKADYLLYGRLYAPSPRLDALYVHRLSSTTQLLISLITVPSPTATPTLSWQNDDPSASISTGGGNGANPTSSSSSSSSSSATANRLSEMEVKVQQDAGRWSSEYSYAVGDGMWGARGLYNFGRWGSGKAPHTSSVANNNVVEGVLGNRERVIDEEDEMPTGLKGRWSAGGEVYFSAQERSAGLSTGLRFSTIPEHQGGPPLQPPTTITATLNPIMGQLSTAYAVSTGRDSSLASRFDFNMYSYDADLTVGGEWYQRKKKMSSLKGKEREVEEEEKRRSKEFDAFGRGPEDEETLSRRRNYDADDEVTACLKLRASTNSDIAMTWEGRMGDFLVSLGLVADLRLATQSRGRVSPIRSVGLGISYWA